MTREVQENKPIIIVSDDFKMFETRITKTSVYGMPVGESSTYSYIRGELGVRTKEHAAALGHGTSSIIPDDVIRDIKRSHARDGVVSDRFDEREHVVVGIPEQHEKLGHPNTIRDVIEAGVNQQAESAQGHERSRRPVRARQ